MVLGGCPWYFKEFLREIKKNSKMAKLKEYKRKNGKLSLKPLKFEEAVKAIVEVKSKPPL
jgi:hypothetical protein